MERQGGERLKRKGKRGERDVELCREEKGGDGKGDAGKEVDRKE